VNETPSSILAKDGRMSNPAMILHGYIQAAWWKPLAILRYLFRSWAPNVGASPIVTATARRVDALKQEKYQRMMAEMAPMNRTDPLYALQMKAAQQGQMRALQEWASVRRSERNNDTDTRA
jgi:hypothetical protein